MTAIIKSIFGFLPHPLRVFFVKVFFTLVLLVALPTLFLLNVVSTVLVGALVVVGIMFFLVRALATFIKRRTERWLQTYFGVMPKEVKPKMSKPALNIEVETKIREFVDAVEELKKHRPTDVRDIAIDMQK